MKLFTASRHALGLALFFGVVQFAGAGVITFNGLALGPQTAGSSFQQDGFTVTIAPGNPGNVATIVSAGGSNVYVDGEPNDSFGTAISIERAGGGTFDLVSLDIANLAIPPDSIVASCSQGGRIELTDNLGECAVFGPGSNTFSTVSPSAGFEDITTLNITVVSRTEFSRDFAVDNIVLSTATVPEPATWTLGIAAFLGIIAARRVRRA